MEKEIVDLLSPFGLDNPEGAIHYGEAVMASMLLEPGDTFTQEEFVKAGQAFYAGLYQIYPHLIFA